MMEFDRRIIRKVAMDVNGTLKRKLEDKVINFKAPYARVTMIDAIKEHTGFDVSGK